MKHEDDIAVDQFAGAMKAKLAAARDKGRSGWRDDCTIESLQAALIKHVHKGDPRDVANYCMFLWQRKAPTVLEDQLVYDATGRWPTKPAAIKREPGELWARMQAAGMYGLLAEVLGVGAVVDDDLRQRIEEAVREFEELRVL